MALGLIGLLALLRTNPHGFVPALPQVVMYEANLRALGPKVGFNTLRLRLPKIKALGVNVLWLMPVQPVGKLRSAGGLGSPYALASLDSLNPEFGTVDEFRSLVDTAHRLKMAVILDWVADHTAWDSPWIAAHPEWYLHDSTGAIERPPGTGWNDVAALDYSNSAMRRAMVQAMQIGIAQFGVDGFRCDAADRIPLDFWKAAILELRAYSPKPLLMLAEGFQASDYTAGFDLTYGWNFCGKLREIFNGKPASELRGAAANEARNLPAGARRLRFTTNHDISAWEGSSLELYKTAEGAKTAFAVAALYGGDPLIYMGQEVSWSKRIPIFQESSIDWDQDSETGRWMARLMALRRARPAFLSGELIDRSTEDVVAFTRSTDTDEALMFANARGHATQVTIPTELQGRWLDGQSNRNTVLTSQLTLPAYTHAIFVRTRRSESSRHP